MDSAQNFHHNGGDVIDIQFNDAYAAQNSNNLNRYQQSTWNTPVQGYNPQHPQQYGPNQGQQIYTQNIPMTNAISQNTVYFDKCCEGVSGGFGPMYFNMRDPNFNKTNAPARAEASLHRCVVVTNLLFLSFLCLTLFLYEASIIEGHIIPMMVVPFYIIYLCSACCCSDIKAFIENTKKNDQYQPTYDRMVQGQGYFTFWIECYHYVTVHTKKGTRRRKVVTHTATQTFTVSQSLDESGQLAGIQDEKSFIFIQYLKRFYFSSDECEQRFKAAFNAFVASNTRDTHQNYTHTFQIQNHEEHVCYTLTGESGKTKALFYIFTLLGLAMPYSCIFESAVTRYQIGILKRLTV